MARKARKRPTVRRAASRPKPSAPRGKGRRSASRPTRAARRPASGKKRAAKPARAAASRAKAPKKAAKRPAAPKRAAAKRSPARGTAPAKTIRAKKPAAKPAPARVTSAAKRPRARRDAQPARPIHALSLDRNRRHLPEFEDNVPTPPSSLDLDCTPSAARSGRQGMRGTRMQHNETSPEITGGDVDASWEDAYSTGDEAPGGDNPTPDQDRVDDIGKALGVQYEDNEELKAADKIAERDRHRWELDPASAEDYPEHED